MQIKLQQKVKVGVNDAGTKFVTLDGVERTLNGSEIMIKDGNNKPMCIGGFSEEMTVAFLNLPPQFS